MKVTSIGKSAMTGIKLVVLGPPLFVVGVTFTILTHAFWERDSSGCPKFPYCMRKTGDWMCDINS
jgi:hypothetical protein